MLWIEFEPSVRETPSKPMHREASPLAILQENFKNTSIPLARRGENWYNSNVGNFPHEI